MKSLFLLIYLIEASLIFIVFTFFISNTMISLFDNEENRDFCQLCDFHPVIQPSSTPRDLIVTATMNYNIQLLWLVRSIRTTGCKAKIIIFTSGNVKLPDVFIQCGIEQVILSHLTARVEQSPFKIRWEWYYQYLSNHTNEYDRIMHVDAYDTFFFGDPFSYASKNDTLYFQQEGRIIKLCPYNRQWLLSCHHDLNKKKILDNIILCSGSLIGGVKPFFEFVELLVTHKEWPQCWGPGFDQGDFNYVFYKHYFISHHKFKYTNCQSRFSTMHYCIRNESNLWNSKGQLQTLDGSDTLIFIHQYNRFPDVNRYISKLCMIKL
ncbi:hypothetical protein TRFO_17453 [Tritrichomonas foetus]|uniref:Nucleotide-diphospho-sugar transferase domain-containing protein n=1 Tax=Tritrichomonas foetus TaxID=1144522 RepID=A0A1J4KT25_9EUKA|nr:hypothetical protein TRFO_17453 [Tritrichomonas foetus]|eukprot:OHT12637.1 hypothetical protein TRFO_17453 [Tritrichomonas foetus]